jgi:hypothetical protein
MSANTKTAGQGGREFVTFRIADQLFGVEVTAIHEVFQPQGVSPVPLAQPEIAGVLNLRGRIVTTVCARRRLGLPPRPEGSRPPMAVGIDKRWRELRHPGRRGRRGVEALRQGLRGRAGEPGPPLGQRQPRRLPPDGRLLVALDVERLLDLSPQSAAA